MEGQITFFLLLPLHGRTSYIFLLMPHQLGYGGKSYVRSSYWCNFIYVLEGQVTFFLPKVPMTVPLYYGTTNYISATGANPKKLQKDKLHLSFWCHSKMNEHIGPPNSIIEFKFAMHLVSLHKQ